MLCQGKNDAFGFLDRRICDLYQTFVLLRRLQNPIVRLWNSTKAAERISSQGKKCPVTFSFKSSKLSPLARPLFIWLAPLTVVIYHLPEFSVTASMVGMIQLPFSTPATMSP